MLDILLHFVPAILILGFLIFVHEWGHFLACRLCGVRVEKFSIGFGPELLRWSRKGTAFTLSLFPLGGFVKPAGESFEELGGKSPEEGDFLAASKTKRFTILIAGVLMNYLVAFLLFAGIFWMGHPVLKATIGGFVKGFPAESSGLSVGDEVVSVNGKPVKNWQEMTVVIMTNEDSQLHFVVKRGGEDVAILMAPKMTEGMDAMGEKRRISQAGIRPGNEYRFEKYSLVESIGMAAATTVSLSALTYKSIWFLVTGKLSPRALSGPVGIMAIANDAARAGFSALLQLTALLSVSLAVVNLLPIPALDGGHIFLLLLGLIMGRELHPRIQERITQAGFIFLIVLMGFVIFNDFVSLGLIDKLKGFFGY